MIKGHDYNDKEHYEHCDICNTQLRLCQFCGRDVAMAGGRGSRGGETKATCNDCLGKKK